MTKPASTKEKSEIILMYQAGYPIPVIAEKYSLSTRTIKRYIKEAGAKKGTLKQEIVDAEKEAFINLLTNDDSFKSELAKMVTSDIVLSNKLKDAIHDNINDIEIATDEDTANLAATKARALAAASTALKNSSEIALKSIGSSQLSSLRDQEEAGHMTYQVRVISNLEAQELQRNKAGSLLSQNELLTPEQLSELSEEERKQYEEKAASQLDVD